MKAQEQARPTEGPGRARQVQSIFSEIAPRYDLLNHVLSFNVDRGWRRKAINRLGWEEVPEGRYLDACAGTFDLSLELSGREGFRGQVLASDFARPMLLEGIPKLEGSPVHPVCGDSLLLPFSDASFEGAMVAFGVRNLSDLSTGLEEFARVMGDEKSEHLYRELAEDLRAKISAMFWEKPQVSNINRQTLLSSFYTWLESIP